MVSSAPELTPKLAATNSAASVETGFATQLHLEMAAFDRLPAYWRAWLRDKAEEVSAVQLTAMLQQRGILPP